MLIFVVYRYLYTDGLPECGERGAGSGGERGEGGSAGGGGGKGKGKRSKCKGGKGADAKGDEEEATRRQVLEREVLKAADLVRVEGMLQHCVEAFRRGLKVDKAIEQLVWRTARGHWRRARWRQSTLLAMTGAFWLQLCSQSFVFCTMSNRFLIDKCLEDGHTKCFLLFLRLHASYFNISYCLCC
jgi:hypothetical protein